MNPISDHWPKVMLNAGSATPLVSFRNRFVKL